MTKEMVEVSVVYEDTAAGTFARVESRTDGGVDLHLYLDGPLTPSEARALAAALDHCAEAAGI